jgi:hypothetical protein
MRGLGGTLFFFGVGSALLNLVGFEFILLMWIDLWGSVIGWLIRIALIVGGGALWLIGRATEKAE